MPLERLVEDVHLDLAVAEDQRVLHLLTPDQAAQRLALVALLHVKHPSGDRRRDGCGARDGDGLGIAQEGIAQAPDFGRHGGREEQRLPQLGDDLHDALDIGDEAHIQHAVGFIDHQQLAIRHQDAAAIKQIEQAAGGGDQHVHAFFQHVALVIHALAADQQRVVQVEILAVFHELLGHLEGQFARRLQDQAARHARLGPAAGEDVHHRQGEAGGLAGAGLGAAHHVPAHQHDGDRLFLNRRRVDVAAFRDRLQKFVGEAKIGEGGARRLGLRLFLNGAFGNDVFLDGGCLNIRSFGGHCHRLGWDRLGRFGLGSDGLLNIGGNRFGAGHASFGRISRRGGVRGGLVQNGASWPRGPARKAHGRSGGLAALFIYAGHMRLKNARRNLKPGDCLPSRPDLFRPHVHSPAAAAWFALRCPPLA